MLPETMNDPTLRDENEIVDLDTCSKKKSLLIAAAITTLLGFVGYSYLFLCIHYAIGGVAAAGHFANRHRVTLTSLSGAKLGAVAAFCGMLVFYVAFPLWYLPSVPEEQWMEMREQVIKQAYESGQPEAAEVAGSLFTSDNVPMFLIGIFVVLAFASLLLGALGGVIGAALFKKGPVAQ